MSIEVKAVAQENEHKNQATHQPPLQLGPGQCDDVAGGYGDGYAVHPGIQGKYTNIWPK
jgi:hypothetical protein